jgi:tetratricopeptide (TPR) repeat protein
MWGSTTIPGTRGCLVDPQTITNATPIERQINVGQADQVNRADNVLNAAQIRVATEVHHADEVVIAGKTDVIPVAPYRLSHDLVGREEELDEFKAKLSRRENLALHGAPGVGKTALAVAIANDPDVVARFPEGVLWAGLGRAPDLPVLLGRWAADLEMTPTEIAKHSTPRALSDAVAKRISLRRMLLVVDDAWDEQALLFRVGGPNCAHILTTRAPALALLFAEEGETGVQELDEDHGFELLAKLAPEATMDEPAIARELVRAVGSLPLALNLLAYRLKRAGLSGQIRESLDSFRVAEERLLLDMPQRPREEHPDLPHETAISLLAVIGISDDALDKTARHALRSLSVFPPKTNTFSEQAALAVSGDPAGSLTELALGWLVERIGDRYAMHQTIADYARSELTDRGAYERMAEFFLRNMEAREDDYLGDRSANWLNWLEAEYENLRTILQRGKEERVEWALRLVAVLWRFWEIRGYITEGRRELEEVLTLPGAQQWTWARAKALGGAGALAYRQGDAVGAAPLFQERLSLLKFLRPEGSTEAADTLNDLGNTLNAQGQYDEARRLYLQSLEFHEIRSNRRGMAVAINNLGYVAFRRGDYEEAKSRLERALTLFRDIGDAWDSGFPLAGLALVALWSGEIEEAAAAWEESLAVRTQVGDRRGMAESTGGLGLVEFWHQRFGGAWDRHTESLKTREELSDTRGIAYSLQNLGVVSLRLDDLGSARGYLERSLAIRRDLADSRGVADCLAVLGRVECSEATWRLADNHYKQSLEIRFKLGDRAGIAESLEGLGELRVAQGSAEEGCVLLGAADAIREAIGAPRWPTDRADLELALSESRQRLGSGRQSTAWLRGTQLSASEARDLVSV